ncbi:NUMOD4 motif-containing HNH endonuclease [Nocardiopsis sp. LOL_012]|uniref:NUMOD4 motif-containing HNH endonuclease n=1 Tax=Nocardiopsis sp. LOL_012 TaxID=3345409 RepID=UPI003A84FB38
MSAEEWRAVVGYEGLYEVSSLGNVRSWTPRKNGEPLTPWLNRNGYLRVALGRDGHHYVHRLVAAAWLGPCPEGQQTRHLDGDKLNNRAPNLAYGSNSDNLLDSVRHGTHPWASRTHCPRGHEYAGSNLYVDPSGRRSCRTCRRERYALERARVTA